jgi:hypothetical protein
VLSAFGWWDWVEQPFWYHSLHLTKRIVWL